MANGFLHAAERKTIKAVLDSQLNKAASQDPAEVLATISGLIDRFGGSNRTATMETIKASLRDRKSTRLNSIHPTTSRMPSSA